MQHTFWIEKPINANPPESQVWFHLEIRGGTLIRLEEHNLQAGGQIGDEDSNLEALFLERVEATGGNIQAAQQLIATTITHPYQQPQNQPEFE